MMTLGGELTLRETMHQVEAIRRVDEFWMRTSCRYIKTADFRRNYGGQSLSASYFEQISDRRNQPRRDTVLFGRNHAIRIIGAEMALREIINDPREAANPAVHRDLRELVEMTVGHQTSVQGLRHAITMRRAVFHPDMFGSLSSTSRATYTSAYLLFDVMAQIAERPVYQRAIFPRGDRWDGPYTRETAMRDAKMLGPALGYLVLMQLLQTLREIAQIVNEVSACIVYISVWCGLNMPSAGEGNPQVLGLPAPEIVGAAA